jgi:succinylarginine dihydrolase
MWCANAATVSPSADTQDGKFHITAANLLTHPHRAIESKQTTRVLKAIFSGDAFVVHEPLVGEVLLDEGAANHMRFAAGPHAGAVNVFVYGKGGDRGKFPSRQSLAASKMIASRHQLAEKHTVFVEQDPDVIEQGVFHNDVIATSNEGVFLVHEKAFKDQGQAIARIKAAFRELTQEDLLTIEIAGAQLSIEEAVRSYFFNSQIVTLPNTQMAIIAPVESSEGKPRAIIDEILKSDNPIKTVYFSDLRQSMANGGGPACLRLRVVLTPEELEQVHPGYLLDDNKIAILEEWIKVYYRETVTIEDLKSAELFEESRKALDELTKVLGIGKIYPFQK